MHSLLEMIATCIERGNADRYSKDPQSALQLLSAAFS